MCVVTCRASLATTPSSLIPVWKMLYHGKEKQAKAPVAAREMTSSRPLPSQDFCTKECISLKAPGSTRHITVTCKRACSSTPRIKHMQRAALPTPHTKQIQCAALLLQMEESCAVLVALLKLHCSRDSVLTRGLEEVLTATFRLLCVAN